MPPESFRTLRPEPVRQPARTWDVVLTIVFLVLSPLATLAASYAGLFLAFAADACGSQNCNTDLMNLGLWSAVIAPWVVFLIAVVVAIVLLVKRRLAFWVPLAGMALMTALWFVSAAIVSLGVSAS
ncbi:hypothetical protein NS220_11695 [Microbacterium testaceum]|uniref:Uncharacterized protein n=2 Tax=Microbacterium testaceum TaxID=2033 RepID=A0A147EVU1_MICTE|nr:hypothetical protein NS220_11695 [Microbacterium testaceum]